jgi:membrane protein YdbS with pleckstrin-like domain
MSSAHAPSDRAIDRLVDRVVCWLRVDAEPRLPHGDPATARVFQGGRNYWRLLITTWSLKQLGTLTALTLAWIFQYQVEWFAIDFPAMFFKFTRMHRDELLIVFRFFERLAWVGLILQLPFGYLANHLAYRMRWYVVTDHAARLRRGVWTLHEQTLTLANVQRIEIRQGPIERWLGLCDLELHTAGGGGAVGEEGSKKSHESLRVARFEGIDLAEATELRKRLEQGVGRTERSVDSGEEREHAPGLDRTIDALASASARLRAQFGGNRS